MSFPLLATTLIFDLSVEQDTHESFMSSHHRRHPPSLSFSHVRGTFSSRGHIYLYFFGSASPHAACLPGLAGRQRATAQQRHTHNFFLA